MTPFPEGSRGGRRPWRPCLAFALLPSLLGGASASSAPAPAPAPAPDREAWRKVEAGSVTVIGTASDARLVETAGTLRALVALRPGLVPGAFGAPPPLVAVVVHDAGHLARAGYPPTGSAGGRIVVAATSDEEARAGFLRAVATALAQRSRAPLPPWLVAGLGEYLSTFSATESRATLGRLVPEHVALLRAAGPPAGRTGLFSAPTLDGEDPATVLLRAQAWAVVHVLLQGTPDGDEQLRRFAELVSEGREGAVALRDAFGENERALLERARRHVVESRPLARVVDVPAGASPVGRLLPLTRTGAAGVLGGVVKGRRSPEPEVQAGSIPLGRVPPPAPLLSSTLPGGTVAVRRDVPAEVDLVNRLIDAGREEEALARLEALHASLGYDREMQSALGWDVGELRRLVTHNRLVRKFNAAVGLLNAGQGAAALGVFREVAVATEDPSLAARARAHVAEIEAGGGRKPRL
ncbi:MAG TPA: hypothetical protein VE129_16225 [Thermoanaerobaculia bacterium]|nr:hypothetical protein [Thermoanaerobaculia bacterium]